MYREFNFTSIDTDAKNKNITVVMTAAIDASTVHGDNIQLLDCTTNHFVLINYEVDREKLIITLPDYPLPNSRYSLVIKGIKDITGNALLRGINYIVEFKSAVKTEAKFIKPAFSEEITDELIFSLQEYIPERDVPHKDDIKFYNSFLIEVSLDNLFNNIIFRTELIDRNSMTVMDLQNGQYYARARVQNNNEYGIWGPIITFVLNKQEKEESDEPIFYKPLTIVSVPKDGDDASSFYIEMSEEVDEDTLDSIKVFRRML